MASAATSIDLQRVDKTNRKTSWVWRFITSSIGAKYIMAISGVILVGFVIGHMAGNLQMFMGWEKLNAYAAFLQSLGELLWVVRIVLLVAVVAHILSGLRLAWINTKARPVRYRKQKSMHTTLFARTMAISGSMLLAFIVAHLLQFTFGVANPSIYAQEDPMGRHDVYAMVVRSFQQPAISAVYIIAMALLGMHLSHGATSMFQSMGANNPKYNRCLSKVGPVLGWLLFLGNIAMPVAVLLGFITLR